MTKPWFFSFSQNKRRVQNQTKVFCQTYNFKQKLKKIKIGTTFVMQFRCSCGKPFFKQSSWCYNHLKKAFLGCGEGDDDTPGEWWYKNSFLSLERQAIVIFRVEGKEGWRQAGILPNWQIGNNSIFRWQPFELEWFGPENSDVWKINFNLLTKIIFACFQPIWVFFALICGWNIEYLYR